MNNQQWIAPEYYNLTSEMERHAPEKIALKWLNEQGDYEEITYGDLRKQANRLAGGLAAVGLQQGDRVLVMVPRRIIAYVIYLACLKLGLAIIPSSEMLRAKDLSYRLRHSEARAVIAWSEITDEVNKISDDLPALDYRLSVSGAPDELGHGWLDLESLMINQPDMFTAVESHRDDMAILAYTSGTTGNPKAVVHSHGWGYAHLRITSPQWLDIKETDTVWATAAPGWQKWIWSPFLSVLGNGATGFVYSGSFHPKNICSCCRITTSRYYAVRQLNIV